jgi:hypothetical protein
MRRFGLGSIAAAVLWANAPAAFQTPPPTPYTAVHDPQFIPASAATFMGDEDRVIGLANGPLNRVDSVYKAYPASILSQHGLVQDQAPDGPIAITW